MPQLDKSTFFNQVIWLLIILGILYFVCVSIILPSIYEAIYSRKLSLNASIQKGYAFSDKLLGKSSINKLFEFFLQGFGVFSQLNLYFFQKLTSHYKSVFEILVQNFSSKNLHKH